MFLIRFFLADSMGSVMEFTSDRKPRKLIDEALVVRPNTRDWMSII